MKYNVEGLRNDLEAIVGALRSLSKKARERPVLLRWKKCTEQALEEDLGEAADHKTQHSE